MPYNEACLVSGSSSPFGLGWNKKPLFSRANIRNTCRLACNSRGGITTNLACVQHGAVLGGLVYRYEDHLNTRTDSSAAAAAATVPYHTG